MKTQLFRNSMLGLAALGAVAAYPDGLIPEAQAAATEPDTLVHMDLTVSKAYNAAMEKAGLDEGQRNVVQAMAHQQAIGVICANFTTDTKRFEDEMNIIYYDDKGKMLEMDSDTLHLRERQVMLGFGMAFGAQLAIAATNEQAFCEHAEMELAARDAKHIILNPRKPG